MWNIIKLGGELVIRSIGDAVIEQLKKAKAHYEAKVSNRGVRDRIDGVRRSIDRAKDKSQGG